MHGLSLSDDWIERRKKMAAKKKTLEESFAQMEEIVQALEQEPESLEESFQLYKKGMDILKECHSAIDTVEKKMIVLEEVQRDIDLSDE